MLVKTGNPTLDLVITLCMLAAPFIASVMVVTEFITGVAEWKGKKATATASGVSVVFFGLIALAYWYPPSVPFVGTFFFLVLGITGPSGGHDLIKKFAGSIGNSR